MLAADGRGAGSRRVFISSVFSEPSGTRWALRGRLYGALRDAGHAPWLYEREGERSQTHGESDKAVILRGLEASDVVVVVYHTRAGSRLPTEPFFATDFEVANAVRLGKRLKLYILGHSYKPSLHAVLAVLTDARVFPETTAVLESETAVVDRVLRDVAAVAARRATGGATTLPLISRRDCERLVEQLNALISVGDYLHAEDRAVEVPLDPGHGLEPDAKHAYARLLGLCANVWANRLCFDRAVPAAMRAIRLYMELGEWREMVSQIQAASGILNMQGNPQAERVNAYGLRLALRDFPELTQAFDDSRGSIMTRGHRLGAAKFHLGRVVADGGSASPYSLSKYAAVVASSGEGKDIRLAQRALYDEALPAARRLNQSLGYVLRHAAALAIATGEYGAADRYISEGEAACSEKGLLHTAANLQRLRSALTFAIR